MRPHRQKFAFAGASALTLILSGCGSSDSTDAASTTTAAAATTSAAAATTSAAASTDTAAAGATITIQNFAYGDPLTVAPGTTITVVNADQAPHNANDKAGSFAEPLIDPGGTTTFVAPNAAGTYDLICTKHPQMSGQLIVS